MLQKGFKFDPKQDFPTADNYLDNLVKKAFSSIIFPTPLFFALNYSFLDSFILTTSTELSR